MATDKLSELSMEFAVEIIKLVKRLKEQKESIISNQIGRSGTYYEEVFKSCLFYI